MLTLSSCLFSSVVPCGNIPGLCKTCLDGCWHWVINTWMDGCGWTGWTFMHWMNRLQDIGEETGHTAPPRRRSNSLPIPKIHVSLHCEAPEERKHKEGPEHTDQSSSDYITGQWLSLGGLFFVQLYHVIIWLNRNHILLTKILPSEFKFLSSDILMSMQLFPRQIWLCWNGSNELWIHSSVLYCIKSLNTIIATDGSELWIIYSKNHWYFEIG